MMSRLQWATFVAFFLTSGCTDWESLYAPAVSWSGDAAPGAGDAPVVDQPAGASADADPEAAVDLGAIDGEPDGGVAPDGREPVALWRFDVPGRPGVQVTAIADLAPRPPDLPLHFDLNRDSGKTEVRDGMLTLDGGFLSAGITPSNALGDVLTRARSVSLELWLKVLPTSNGTILTTFTPIGDKTAGRAFAIVQRDNVIHFSVHTTATDATGEKFLGATMTAAEIHARLPLEATVPVHVVALYSDADKSAEIYLDGVRADVISHHRPGTPPPALVWTHEKYELGLGGAFDVASTWRGSLYLAAVYDRALGAGEIKDLYSAGPARP
jgi:hypothetical protein